MWPTDNPQRKLNKIDNLCYTLKNRKVSLMSKTTKSLILLSDLGLCNRLISMANYAAICEHSGRKLLVYWPLNESVDRTDFTEVFSNGDLIITMPQLWDSFKEKSSRVLPLRFGLTESNNDADLALINKIPKMEEQVLVATLSCYFEPQFMPITRFYSLVRQFLLGLDPVDSIKPAVNDFCEKHEIHPDNPRVLGLHIRRTDRRSSAEISSEAAFADIIQKEINCWKSVKFFLATDSAKIQARLSGLFSENIITWDKKKFRGEQDLTYSKRTTSLHDAVIELYILSRCHHIYGSYGSSFSKVASVLRGIKFHQVGFV